MPENDASTPATAAALVHKCVTQEHANFIFGPESTATTAAAVPVANQLQTVLLGWGSGWAGQGISAANLNSYAFPGIGNVYFADDQAMITQLIVPRHYTRVAVIQDNTPGGLSNLPYMQGLASKYGYQIVASQIVNPGSTNDTPQVLNLLKANPQVIVLGLTPGPDTITFLKSMRAQNPTIPIGECSGCATTQFVNAVGGPTTMSNIYLIGTPENVLAAFPSSGANAAGIADTKAYIAAMTGGGPGHGDPDRRGRRGLGHRTGAGGRDRLGQVHRVQRCEERPGEAEADRRRHHHVHLDPVVVRPRLHDRQRPLGDGDRRRRQQLHRPAARGRLAVACHGPRGRGRLGELREVRRRRVRDAVGRAPGSASPSSARTATASRAW